MPYRKSGATRSKTDARIVKGRDNEEKALELRAQFLSLREIGRRLDLTAEGVSQAIQRGLARSHDSDIVKSVRLIAIERYGLMIEADFYKALNGDEKARVRVLEVMLRMEKVAGCHQELSQGIGGPAVAFNYYMPVAEKSDIIHVDPDDYNLPRPELGSGINTNGNGVANE